MTGFRQPTVAADSSSSDSSSTTDVQQDISARNTSSVSFSGCSSIKALRFRQRRSENQSASKRGKTFAVRILDFPERFAASSPFISVRRPSHQFQKEKNDPPNRFPTA